MDRAARFNACLVQSTISEGVPLVAAAPGTAPGFSGY